MFAAVVVVATLVDDKVVVTAIDKKPKKLWSVPAPTSPSFLLGDAHTLWLADHDAKTVTVAKIVDGKTVATKQYTPADWKLPATVYPVPSLALGAHGEVLVGIGKAWLRVDGDAPQLVDASVLAVRPDVLAPLPAPPAGYTTHLRPHDTEMGTLQAVSCTGPGAKRMMWFSEIWSAAKVTWMRTAPPIAQIDTDYRGLPMPTPMPMPRQGSGGSDDIDLDLDLDALSTGGRHGVVYLESCTHTYDRVFSLGGALWAGEHDGTTWVWQDARLLATLKGWDAVAAPER
ncbi:MAG: hypothetical protein JO257_16820 [Deltaproteobacteria bacterium]|nr:hypothetical protein [Deltaproteobacteria bacterium]